MRTRQLFAMAICAGSLAACELATSALPPADGLLEVRGVLVVGDSIQRIIVSRAFGSAGTTDPAAAQSVTGASVTVTSAGGHVYVAREAFDTLPQPSDGLAVTTRDSSRGYVFSTQGAEALIAGEIYALAVRTTAGETVTGSTRTPMAVAGPQAVMRGFNRDRDTLALAWAAAPDAAAYGLRVDGPSGAFTQFLTGTSVRLTGDLRSLQIAERPTIVFAAGFAVPVTVAVVDANYYDYFRSASDPFTGLGRINRLVGAYGVFGSVVPVVRASLEVGADVRDSAIEGHWRLVGDAPPVLVSRGTDLRLYLDPAATGSGSAERPLTGSYVDPDDITRGQVVGTRTGQALMIRMVRGTLVHNVIDGVVRGDSLFATYRTDGLSTVFIRVR